MTRPGARAQDGSALGVIGVAVVLSAAFGPYLPLPGLRTEQVAVYLTFAVGVVGLWFFGARLNGYARLTVALLATETVVALVGAIRPPENTSPFPTGSALAGLDNLVLPIVAVLMTGMLAGRGRDADRMLRTACTVVVAACCVNAALAVATIHFDLSPWLSSFWTNDSAEAVAQRATELGRYTGIFNQPAEAGTAYSLALLAAVHVCRNRPLLMAVAATTLTVGGVLTVSKAFLLAGLPVGLWHLVRTTAPRPGRLVVLGAAASALGAAAVAGGLFTSWIGTGFLTRLLHPGGDGSVGLYTAGRLGANSTLRATAEAILGSSPVFGFGAGGLSVAYDNGWIEALAVAGLFGTLLYTAVIATLAAAWWRTRGTLPAAHSRLAGGIILVLAAASMGVPALTANRVATVAWVLITLLLFVPRTATPITSAHPVGPARRPLPRPPAADLPSLVGVPAGAP